ncbi:MAG: IPTL-CTERM sorting domain-containing protein [Pseudomonadota bacterium]
MKKIAFAAAAAVAFALSASTQAGPVVIGGDDLNDHGSWDGSANLEGWLYIQNALASLIPQVTLSGNDGTIVVLGSDPSSIPTVTSDDGCTAAYFPAQALVPPRTVNCIEGDVAIAAYLSGVAGGTNRPAVIVYPGNGTSNDVDAAEEAAWAAGATTIANYVAAGGGLLAHEGDFTWLTALLPGIVVTPSCVADPGATLTTAGSTAFPTLTDADINAGPCHASFSGDFGGLQVLANDGSVPPLPFILGGGSGTTFEGAPMSIPALNPWMLALLAALLGLMALHGLGRRRPDSN